MRLRQPFGERTSVPIRDPSTPGLPLDRTVQGFVDGFGMVSSAVPEHQPPALDMPALPVLILDALADDAETIFTMRDCGDMKPRGIAIVGEAHLLNALRTLLADDLIEVEVEHIVTNGRMITREPQGPPLTSNEDLKRYLFVMTRAGRAASEAADDELAAYADTHPLHPKP